MTTTPADETSAKSFTEKAKDYDQNFATANKAVSDRTAKSRAGVGPKLAEPSQARDIIAVARDLSACERRQADQRAKLRATDAELTTLRMELKAMADQAGREK